MKSCKIHVLLTQAEKDGLRRLAKELDMSQSSLGRLAIRAMLKAGLVIPGFDPQKK